MSNIEAKKALPIVSDGILAGINIAIGSIGNLTSKANSISALVESEDSELAKTFQLYTSALEDKAQKIEGVLASINSEWQAWCQASISNEATAETDVSNIYSNIQAILQNGNSTGGSNNVNGNSSVGGPTNMNEGYTPTIPDGTSIIDNATGEEVSIGKNLEIGETLLDNPDNFVDLKPINMNDGYTPTVPEGTTIVDTNTGVEVPIGGDPSSSLNIPGNVKVDLKPVNMNDGYTPTIPNGTTIVNSNPGAEVPISVNPSSTMNLPGGNTINFKPINMNDGYTPTIPNGTTVVDTNTGVETPLN